MKALQGVEGELEWTQRDAPQCAAGLNRADLLQRAGHYPPPPGVTDILGLECAGVISEVGAGSGWKVGDRVCALLAGGGMAEEVVVDARHALPVPEGLSLQEAAVIPEVYATAWLNLYRLGALQPGERVLLHAGASGVGSAAIQLCKALDNPCWVSVGSAERLAYCESLGAQGGVLRGETLDALRDFAPFDLVLDPVGAKYAALNLQVLGKDARWVMIGLMGGRKGEVDFGTLLAKRIQLIGSTLRSRDADDKAELMAELQERVWPLFASGQLTPRLERTFPIGDVEAAFAALASNTVSGKLALVIDESLV